MLPGYLHPFLNSTAQIIHVITSMGVTSSKQMEADLRAEERQLHNVTK